MGDKRGHYKQKECPFCHEFVGNLGNHIRLKHPAEVLAKPTELTKENLLNPEPEEPVTPPERTYQCLGCGAEVRKNENPCWNCGAFLNWEGIE